MLQLQARKGFLGEKQTKKVTAIRECRDWALREDSQERPFISDFTEINAPLGL